jgi:capsular polysaccharide export protein
MQGRTESAPGVPPLPGRLYAVGFSGWKRPFVRICFPDSEVRFVESRAAVPKRGAMVLWGMRGDAAELAADSIVLRVEDGFLRSVGLGTDLTRPVSWVVDRRGIYFNARQESDLEHLLSHATFSPDMLARSARLRERIISAGLTKYNIGRHGWRRPHARGRVILVPGQVETDASIAYGAAGVRTNIELLQAVRREHPADHVVYKPHPDVVARLRARGVGEERASEWCDEVIADASMSELLDAVDEVHVITSLAGFEALLRGKRVVCHGQPFYSGWGLTRDLAPVARRTRKLALDELIAGALIAYPRYFSRDGERLLTPEEAVEELVRWKASAGTDMPWWRRFYRVVLRQVVGVR